jgi:hypothetical protein
MRSRFIWFAFAATLLMALACIDGSDAQPEKKGPPFGKKGGPFPGNITADQIVERIMSFDKNNDGKITIDELPERMQHLIALGDVNKDGALDKSEIAKLASTLEAFTGLTGGGGPPPGAPPKGAFPKGAFAKGGPKGPLKGAAAEAQRTLDDLNVTGSARDKAERALRAQQDKMRRYEELTRAELIVQMKEALNEEDFKAFKTALERPPGPPGFKGPRLLDVNTRIEQVQKDVEDMRRKLAQ